MKLFRGRTIVAPMALIFDLFYLRRVRDNSAVPLNQLRYLFRNWFSLSVTPSDDALF